MRTGKQRLTITTEGNHRPKSASSALTPTETALKVLLSAVKVEIAPP